MQTCWGRQSNQSLALLTTRASRNKIRSEYKPVFRQQDNDRTRNMDKSQSQVSSVIMWANRVQSKFTSFGKVESNLKVELISFHCCSIDTVLVIVWDPQTNRPR